MKGILSKKWLGIPVLVLVVGIVTVLAAAGVLAAATLTQHNTINIVAGGGGGGGGLQTPNLALFVDQAGATPLTDPLAWGDLNANGSMQKTYWVKNTGTAAAASVSLVAPTVAWGTVTVAPTSITNLAVGGVVEVTVTVQAGNTTQAGATFDVTMTY